MRKHRYKTGALVALIHFSITGVLAFWGFFNFLGNALESNETTEINQAIAAGVLWVWNPPVMVTWNAYWKEKEKTEFTYLVYQELCIGFGFSLLIGAGTSLALKNRKYN